MADPHKILSSIFVAEVVRWPSGALGWANHVEQMAIAGTETDRAAFEALMKACTVPPIPPDQQVLLK